MCVIDAEIASDVQRFGNSRSQQFDVGACVTVSIIDRLFYIPQFQGVKSPSSLFLFYFICWECIKSGDVHRLSELTGSGILSNYITFFS